MTLGILGGGQLGWMLGIAARRLGIECVYLDPAESCTADLVGDRIRADFVSEPRTTVLYEALEDDEPLICNDFGV